MNTIVGYIYDMLYGASGGYPSFASAAAIIPFVPLTRADFMRVVIEIVPSSVEPLAISVINDVYQQSVGLISFSIVAILWSAGKGLLALLRGLNVINGVEEKRNYLVLRIVTSFYMVLILFVIILTLLRKPCTMPSLHPL